MDQIPILGCKIDNKSKAWNVKDLICNSYNELYPQSKTQLAISILQTNGIKENWSFAKLLMSPFEKKERLFSSK